MLNCQGSPTQPSGVQFAFPGMNIDEDILRQMLILSELLDAILKSYLLRLQLELDGVC